MWQGGSALLWHAVRQQRWGEDLGKLNIWCEDTQLQDPSTVNTCVMLNRMDKWGGGCNNGTALHCEHVSQAARERVAVCVRGRVCRLTGIT